MVYKSKFQDDNLTAVDQNQDDNVDISIDESSTNEIVSEVKEDNSDQNIVDSKELSSLKEQIEQLKKQNNDSKSWGRQQRAAYSVAKKRVEDLSKTLLDEGTIFDEEYEKLKNVFEHSFDTEEFEENTKKQNDPFDASVDNIRKIFDEKKKWSDDKDLDLKFAAFFHHMNMLPAKKVEDIKEFFSSEQDSKILLDHVLSEGDKYYNKLYKKAKDKGDIFSYVEDLADKNEILEKKVKELTLELAKDTDRVYSKSLTSSRGDNKSSSNGAWQSKFD